MSIIKNSLLLGLLSLLLIQIGTFGIHQIANGQLEMGIPGWVKNNAGWWANGEIDDDSFVQGIQFLIQEGVMKIPLTTQVTDSDDDEIPDDVDVCPNQAETINQFEDSDGCPEIDKSLTISDIEITTQSSGWGDQRIKISWTYYVEHIDISGVGFPSQGHFVIEITGIETIIDNAEFTEDNKFTGEFNGIDPGIGGGPVTLTIISFIGDDRGNYVGDGDKEEIIIPPFAS